MWTAVVSELEALESVAVRLSGPCHLRKFARKKELEKLCRVYQSANNYQLNLFEVKEINMFESQMGPRLTTGKVLGIVIHDDLSVRPFGDIP